MEADDHHLRGFIPLPPPPPIRRPLSRLLPFLTRTFLWHMWVSPLCAIDFHSPYIESYPFHFDFTHVCSVVRIMFTCEGQESTIWFVCVCVLVCVRACVRVWKLLISFPTSSGYLSRAASRFWQKWHWDCSENIISLAGRDFSAACSGNRTVEAAIVVEFLNNNNKNSSDFW